MEAPTVTVNDFVDRYGGVTEAAAALGVDRVTLWRWNKGEGHLPKAWAYKAQVLMRSKRKRNAR